MHGGGKVCDFWPKLPLISETVRDRRTVTNGSVIGSQRDPTDRSVSVPMTEWPWKARRKDQVFRRVVVSRPTLVPFDTEWPNSATRVWGMLSGVQSRPASKSGAQRPPPPKKKNVLGPPTYAHARGMRNRSRMMIKLDDRNIFYIIRLRFLIPRARM